MTGVVGSFSGEGWRMEIGAGGAPRFVRDTSEGTGVNAAPNALPGDERWDDRLGNTPAGLNGSVRAIAVIGSDIYVGGGFTQSIAANKGEVYIGVKSVGSGNPANDFGVMQWDGTRFIPLRNPTTG